MAELSPEEALTYETISALGDQFARLIKSEEYQLLEAHILKPLEQRAFTDFSQIDPGDVPAITEVQMAKKLVDRLRNKIYEKVEEGKNAKNILIYSTKEEDYA